MLGRTNTGGGGGGGGLNFQVIPNPQPSTAKENTIWVDTDRINNYYFCATQPENMAEYDVWFPISTSSTVAFSATKKNPIMVYPLSAKQMVSGALVDKTAKSWQGGEWVDWVTYLYNSGNENTDITGGLSAISTSGTLTKNAGSLTFSTDSNGAFLSFATTKLIKKEHFKKLVFHVTDNGDAVRVGVSKTRQDSWSGWSHVVSLENKATGYAELELTNNTPSEFYVICGCGRGLGRYSITIDAIYLK